MAPPALEPYDDADSYTCMCTTRGGVRTEGEEGGEEDEEDDGSDDDGSEEEGGGGWL